MEDRFLEDRMTKSELIERLAGKMHHLPVRNVENAVRLLLDEMTDSLTSMRRIEIRGFGSFTIHLRPSRPARNPKTGDQVAVEERGVPHFKPGKEMRERINQRFLQQLYKQQET
jgi:integration host factor subunit beta